MQFSVRRILEARTVHAKSQRRVRDVLQNVSEDHTRNGKIDQSDARTTKQVRQVRLLVSQRKEFLNVRFHG